MCGIISASSKTNIDFNSIKLGMLQADDRGGHSCGISVKGEENNVIRQVANAKTFVNDKGEDVQIPRNNKSFIGHTRWATQGEKSIPNTHPFIFGDIIGVHNGSIDNFKDLKSKYIQDYRNDVEEWCGEDWKETLNVDKRTDIDVNNDSKLLYYMIWKKGLPAILPELQGSLALVFYKEENGEEYMYFYRYDKPLCYGYRGDEDNKEMWIGSLKKYLDGLGCKNIKNVTEHAIYKVKDGNIITSKQQPQDIKPKEKKSVKDDFDEDLEPERARRTTTTTTTTGNSTSDKQREAVRQYMENKTSENKSKDGFRFCAPKSARGDTNRYGNLVLYWFSNNNPHVVYVEEEGVENVGHYDMRQSKQIQDLKDDYPTIYKDVVEEYGRIEITLEYREEIETV